MTTDTAALISRSVEWRKQEAVIDRAFPQRGDSTLIVIDGATPELAEIAAAKLAERLSADHVHFHSVNRPDGGEFFNRAGLLYATIPEVQAGTQRMIAAQPFLGPLAADPSLRGVAGALSTMAEGVSRGAARLDDLAGPMAALADALPPGKPAKHFSWQRLIGGGAGALAAPSRRLVLAWPRLDFGSLKPGEAASNAIRQLATELKLDAAHGVHISLTGVLPLADEEFASLEHRAWLIGTAMFAAMLLTLWLALRSKRIVAAIMLTTIAGLFITMALGLLVVGQFNLISVAFIPLFVGLGIDFGIQIGVRYRAELMEEEDRTAAVCAAAIALGPSLLLAAGAICLGFLAFLPTAYVGVAELGIIAALGMVVALLLAMTLLPAILMLMSRPMARHEPPTERLARLDRGLITHRRYVLLAFGVAMIASIASLAFVQFDFNPLHLRDPKGEAMATLNGLMNDPDLTPNTIDALAPNLAAAQTLKGKLVALPEVRRAITLQDFSRPTSRPSSPRSAMRNFCSVRRSIRSTRCRRRPTARPEPYLPGPRPSCAPSPPAGPPAIRRIGWRLHSLPWPTARRRIAPARPRQSCHRSTLRSINCGSRFRPKRWDLPTYQNRW
jgi:hopanoid biosynthesis associated RND transporter like protein HpnN